MNALKYFSLLLLLFLPIAKHSFSAQNDSKEPQRRLLALLGDGFQLEGGFIAYPGGNVPVEAVASWCSSKGISGNFSLGGISPFKRYSREEYRRSALHFFSVDQVRSSQNMAQRLLPLIDRWKKNFFGQRILGQALLEEMLNDLGPDCFHRLHGWQVKNLQAKQAHDALQRDRQAWATYYVNLFFQPSTYAILGGLSVLSCLCFMVLPLFFSHLFTWLFKDARPKILGKKDTNIPKSWWAKKKFEWEELPELIVNITLKKNLDRLIKKNKKGQIEHLLFYGVPGVGKTLFAKSLAKKSNMNFMYLSLESLSQLANNEAIHEFKRLIAYAKKKINEKSTILILDECEILGTTSLLIQLEHILLQEFSSATGKSVQLCLITNFPNRLSKPLLSRIGNEIFFGPPSLETARKLFESYLAGPLKEALASSDLSGLVGRDIALIASRHNQSKKNLKATIATWRGQKKQREDFKNHDYSLSASRKAISNPPLKQEKKWWF